MESSAVQADSLILSKVPSIAHCFTGPVFSYKLRYIVGLWLVEMAISTNHKPEIYRNLYENTDPEFLPTLIFIDS